MVFRILAPKTKLRRFQRVKAAQSLIPVNCRSSSEGTGDNACTHNRRRFISRSFNWRSVQPRSARTHFHESPHFSKERAVPFGFWCGGFSSTAGYVPGNEAQACARALCYPPAVLSGRRDPFLSGRFRKVLRLSPASLSASAWGE